MQSASFRCSGWLEAAAGRLTARSDLADVWNSHTMPCYLSAAHATPIMSPCGTSLQDTRALDQGGQPAPLNILHGSLFSLCHSTLVHKLQKSRWAQPWASPAQPRPFPFPCTPRSPPISCNSRVTEPAALGWLQRTPAEQPHIVCWPGPRQQQLTPRAAQLSSLARAKVVQGLVQLGRVKLACAWVEESTSR